MRTFSNLILILILLLSTVAPATVVSKAVEEKTTKYEPLTEKTPFQAWDCNAPTSIASFDMTEVGQCENPNLGRQEKPVKIQVIKAVEEFELKVVKHIFSTYLLNIKIHIKLFTGVQV